MPLLASGSLLALTVAAGAQSSPPVLNVCAGPSVSLPVLTPVTTPVDTSIVAGTLNPLLGGLVGNINTSLTAALSGKPLSVSVLDSNGNLISAPTGGCSLTTNNGSGITLGGGRLDGLGGTANATALAGDPTAIAIGNGAQTSPSVTNALALGTGASATASGGVALGAGSAASRLNAPSESFTGAALRSTLGAVSVGAAGAERQITNVAGGSQPTDAINLRQLQAVGSGLAGGLGAGANLNPATGAFTAPSYVIGSTTYRDVGSALNAISSAGNGLVQQVAAGAPITVGAATDGAAVSLAGTAGLRTLTGLGAGTVATGSTDAVTGAQLAARQAGIAGNTASLGGGAVFNPTTGTYTNPSYVLRGTSYSDVGAALSALAADPVLVSQATSGAPITVGAGTGGTTITVAGTAGTRTLAGLSPGLLAVGSTQAVNGSQLFATNTALNATAALFGAGTTLNAGTGALTLPSFVVGSTIYRDVGSAIAAIDVALTLGAAGGTGGVSSTPGQTYPIAGNHLASTTQPVAAGDLSVAAGFQAKAIGISSSALGDTSLSQGDYSTSVGGQSQALGLGSAAVGAQSMAADLETTAIGGRAVARFQGSTAIGSNAQAIADPTTAVGYYATASGNDAVVVGAYSTASGNYSAVVGAYATVSGINATAVGHSSSATGQNSTALGMGASAVADGSVALGSGSVADRPNAARELFTGADLRTSLGTVSVGSAGNERQITNVAGGTAPTDAVNVRQLQSVGNAVTASLGGGAGFDSVTGAYTAPRYTVAGRSYGNVGAAVSALDASGVKYDIDPSTGQRTNSVTLAGGDPNTPVLVRNVASGVLATDAATMGQVRAAQASGVAYTDQRVAETLNSAKTYTDQQIAAATGGYDRAFAQVNQDMRELRREARGAAAVGLAAASLRYDDRPGKISLAAGGGAWRGEGAAAFGVGYTSQDGMARFNVGATTTGGQWGVGGGFSLTLN